jgi:hypothetical protein
MADCRRENCRDERWTPIAFDCPDARDGFDDDEFTGGARRYFPGLRRPNVDIRPRARQQQRAKGASGQH